MLRFVSLYVVILLKDVYSCYLLAGLCWLVCLGKSLLLKKAKGKLYLCFYLNTFQCEQTCNLKANII